MQSDRTQTTADRTAALAACSGREMPSGYRLIHTATILRDGWEMDNRLWIIEGPHGLFTASTNHGGIRVPADEKLDSLIQDHELALASLHQAKALMEAECATR